MLEYSIAFIATLAAILIYFKIAGRYNIIDKPNERSSHTYTTIRGGGIIFPLAAFYWFIYYGFLQPWMITGLALIAIVSFLDDLFTLPGWIRILAQVIAVYLLLYQTGHQAMHWYLVLSVFIFTIGWINGFNFMDGINAITPFYSLVALGTFAWLNRELQFIQPDLPVILIIAVLVFSIFNARKRARAFAGDVGSVSMAYLLAALMLALFFKSGRIEYILFFFVYALDIVFTIIFRLKRRENIFRAHRSHLYQYLSNEMQWPHVLVSALYAVVQLIINIITIILIKRGKMSLAVFISIIVALSVTYLFVRWIVQGKIKDKIPLREMGD